MSFTTHHSLTSAEQEILAKTAELWNAYVALPDEDEQCTRTALEAIHAIQSVIAIRLARRVNPNTFRNAKPSEFVKPGAGAPIILTKPEQRECKHENVSIDEVTTMGRERVERIVDIANVRFARGRCSKCGISMYYDSEIGEWITI